jgi:hypothetical protein
MIMGEDDHALTLDVETPDVPSGAGTEGVDVQALVPTPDPVLLLVAADGPGGPGVAPAALGDGVAKSSSGNTRSTCVPE